MPFSSLQTLKHTKAMKWCLWNPGWQLFFLFYFFLCWKCFLLGMDVPSFFLKRLRLARIFRNIFISPLILSTWYPTEQGSSHMMRKVERSFQDECDVRPRWVDVEKPVQALWSMWTQVAQWPTHLGEYIPIVNDITYDWNQCFPIKTEHSREFVWPTWCSDWV